MAEEAPITTTTLILETSTATTETSTATTETSSTATTTETSSTTTTTETSTTTTTEEKTTTVKRKNWLPLESNPELMSKYITKLGVDDKFTFHEVLGCDEMLLSMVPQPVHALLMAFPLSVASEKHKEEQEKLLSEKGQTVGDKVWFIRQNIGNACGTIGLLHAVLNATADGRVTLVKDKFFSKFYEKSKQMCPLERAKALELNEDIEEEHQVIAQSEGTAPVSHSTNMNMHFNAFTIVDGHLYEFDGRKKRPINHGECSSDDLLKKAIAVIQKFMARDPKEIRFNIVTLGEK